MPAARITAPTPMTSATSNSRCNATCKKPAIEDMTMEPMRLLSGIQPSGNLHLGNYFGMMKPAIELQARGEAFLFIANYHALTSVSDPASLRRSVRDVA